MEKKDYGMLVGGTYDFLYPLHGTVCAASIAGQIGLGTFPTSLEDFTPPKKLLKDFLKLRRRA